MATPASVDFLDSLSRCRLLTPAQCAEVRDQAARFPEPRALARHLLERDWLTPYQVNQLFLGRGQGLAIGPYIILERLGEGGAGQVFKARHQHMQRTAALKVIRPELLSDGEVVARFYREVRVLSQLSHPNVVHAYDAGPFGPTHFLVMEHIEGTDLGRLVKQGGPMTVEKAVDTIRQAALGLDHAHQRGLVHRDIKPSNLLIAGVFPTPSGSFTLRTADPSPRTESMTTRALEVGVVKLLDLGLALLAAHANGEVTSTLTTPGSVTMGTPDYMAPEQAIDFHAVDIRADLYSLGCTLFFLLTGQPPFPGGTMAQKLMRHQQAPPPPLSRFRADVPPTVEAVLRRMLAKHPQDRPQTPAELIRLLQAPEAVPTAIANLSTTPLAPLVVAEPPPALPVGLAPRGRWGLAVGLVAAILALMAGTFGLVLLALLSRPTAAAQGPTTEPPVPMVAPLALPRPTTETTRPVMPPRPGPAQRVVLPQGLDDLLALRTVIHPRLGEDRWTALDWQLSLWEGRKRAAELGRPLLLWVGRGHPLGMSCTTTLEARRGALASPEVQALLAQFILVPCDAWSLERQADAEGDFFRACIGGGKPQPINQLSLSGFYAATPDGQQLGRHRAPGNEETSHDFLAKALADWNALPEARRRAVAVEALTAVDRRFHPELAARGTAIAVSYRSLTPSPPNSWQSFAPAGRDRLWLSDAETLALVQAASQAKKNLNGTAPLDLNGVSVPLGRLLGRLHRFHLIDPSIGEPEPWQASQLLPRTLQISASSTPERFTLGIVGPFALATAADPTAADRGFVGQIGLVLAIDLQRQEIIQFEGVAIGEPWRPGQARSVRSYLGVAFQLVPPNADRRVPPYMGVREPLEYFPPLPAAR